MQLSHCEKKMKTAITVMVVLLTASCGSSDYSNFMDNCNEQKNICMSPARLEKHCECLGNAIYNHEMNGKELPQEYQMSVEAKQQLIGGNSMPYQGRDSYLWMSFNNACLLQNMPKTKAEQEDEAKYCKK